MPSPPPSSTEKNDAKKQKNENHKQKNDDINQ